MVTMVYMQEKRTFFRRNFAKIVITALTTETIVLILKIFSPKKMTFIHLCSLYLVEKLSRHYLKQLPRYESYFKHLALY
jgi:hypothetical protein